MSAVHAGSPDQAAPGKRLDLRGAFASALALVNDHWRSYVIINAVYYGLVVVGMIYVWFDRSIQVMLMNAIGQAFGPGGFFGPVGEAYGGGQALSAIALTFGINLLVGSFISITLPALLIPFSGLLVGGYRAVVWGFIFTPPADVQLTAANILTGLGITILLLLEGQGYVLAMFATYLQGLAFLFPRRAGVESRWQGYWLGLKLTARLYLLVGAVLLIAALYEVLLAVVLVPLLQP